MTSFGKFSLNFAMLCFICSEATAEPLFDTLNYAYPNAAWIVGDHSGDYFADLEVGLLVPMAEGAPPSSRYRVDSYSLRLRKTFVTYPVNIEFSLFANANGTIGPLLDTVILQEADESFAGAEYTLASTTHPVVQAGKQYWFIARAPDTFGGIEWFHVLPYSTGNIDYTVAARSGDDPWTIYNTPETVGALRILGTPLPVPEPSSAALLTYFVSCFAIGRRVRSA
jgi:hypothetical protein